MSRLMHLKHQKKKIWRMCRSQKRTNRMMWDCMRCRACRTHRKKRLYRIRMRKQGQNRRLRFVVNRIFTDRAMLTVQESSG